MVIAYWEIGEQIYKACGEKNDAVVKYTLPEGNNQIFASKYFTYLPTEEELKRKLRINAFQKLGEE